MITADVRRMQTTEMRMISMMCGKTLLEKNCHELPRENGLVLKILLKTLENSDQRGWCNSTEQMWSV